MSYMINANLAHRYGFVKALVLQFITCELLAKSDSGEEPDVSGDYWCRISHQMLSLKLPILTKETSRRALEGLMDANLIKKKEINESCFDRTASYTLTEYGVEVMVNARV